MMRLSFQRELHLIRSGGLLLPAAFVKECLPLAGILAWTGSFCAAQGEDF